MSVNSASVLVRCVRGVWEVGMLIVLARRYGGGLPAEWMSLMPVTYERKK